ncbi:TRAP transporter small permease subunit [Pseudomonas lopnurensis]|uniref:TRAP transporter small permease subunit n=1 Tax=Pseudomonas lopnurensis TaxID=1477517 RepID=UPI00187917B8|nr:TRAP transporter small permease [Pseudomonas lopnurensis]MBE7376394.1 TRAP transporter small permease [Pseudomonas lopnurensis]
MSRRFIRSIEALSRLGGVSAVFLLIIAMVVMCQMILMRYLFRAPTIWQTEVVVFAATAAIFIGAPYVLMKKGHVGVDVIELMLSPPNRRRMQCLGAVLGLTFCLLMSVASGIYVHEAWEGGWTTPTIAAIPLWIPATPMLVGFGLLCLQYVVELMKLICPELATPQQQNAATEKDETTLHSHQNLGEAP